jgi:hypothetical protein
LAVKRRWVPYAFVGAAAVTVPWIGYLAVALPETEVIHNRTVWVGFDIGLVIMLGLTGWMYRCAHPRADLAAVATATMLLTDAWFDTLTSRRGTDRYAALAFAVVELSMAAFCLWVVFRERDNR